MRHVNSAASIEVCSWIVSIQAATPRPAECATSQIVREVSLKLLTTLRVHGVGSLRRAR
jgi:hypothetical protein